MFLVNCGQSGGVSTIQQPVIICVGNDCFNMTGWPVVVEEVEVEVGGVTTLHGWPCHG